MKNDPLSEIRDDLKARLDLTHKILIKHSSRTMKYDVYKGRAGVALFFHYYGKAFNHAPSLQRAKSLITKAVKQALSDETELSLYAGIPGVLWAARKILGPEKELTKLLPKGYRQVLLLKMAESLRYAGFHELSHGAAGWWVFSESVPSSSWFREVVLEYLRRTRNFEKNEWWTASGEIGFGIAHGICAPLLIRKSRADVKRLKSFIKPFHSKPLPPLYPKRLNDFPVQSAWCYGDAGAGFAFTKLSYELNDQAFMKISQKIFRRGIIPSPEYREIDNAFICHGFAGQALLSLRFWKLTGNKDDLHAVRLWSEKIASIPVSEFKKFETFGLHDGCAGLGLVLIALLKQKPESWDRLLLLS